ncbi:tyrosine-type recombinase/integrase [Anaerovorax odorimutans]|uniref:Tyrosine-type recombinase/integrase n=1 Tax=Anaerovorax odorimutans TaxID=109327 RepID=A0ABT1RQR3_9FIRM|nr:tyrosine-type recombinase/integrase [Anaerovorax odorimutans]MCQ4637537.1 tyrosine-type recombinase/integrase [Anaerovorax odorimutans]
MNLKEQVLPYLEYCEFRKELDKKTLKAYRIDLRQFFEFLAEKEVSKGNMESYITYLHKSFRQKTVKRKIASLRAFFNHLEDEELLDTENPFRKIKVKFKEKLILPRVISRNDIEKLLNYIYKTKRTATASQRKIMLRDLAVIELFFATGARVYEISNLKKSNIDLNSGAIRIMGKGGKERYIQIGSAEVLSLLNEYYKENEQEIKRSEYFFVNRRGLRLTEQSIRGMIKKYSKEAAIETHITPHMFRHSFATYLIEEGVDISYVQDILGHSSIKTTQIYVHIASEKKAEILRAKHPRLRMNITAA